MTDAQATLEEWMNTFGQSVWTFVYAYVRHPDVADDIAQEVFISAYRHQSDFRADASVKTWLFAIAKNRCLDYIKAERRRLHRLEAATLQSSGAFVPSAESTFLEQTLANEVWTAVLRLPPRPRAIVVLRMREGLSFGEIASIIGSTEVGARVRFHRAMRSLRTLLGEEGLLHEV